MSSSFQEANLITNETYKNGKGEISQFLQLQLNVTYTLHIVSEIVQLLLD